MAMSDEENLQGLRSGDEQKRSRGRVDTLGWGAIVSAIILGGLSVVVTYFLVTELYRVLAVFGAGFLLAYFLEPVISYLDKRGLGRTLSAWAVYLMLLAALILAIWSIVPQLTHQVLGVAENFPAYVETVIEGYRHLREETVTVLGQYISDPGAFGIIDERIPLIEDWTTRRIPGMLRWGTRQVVASLRGAGIVLLLLLIGLEASLLSHAAWVRIRALLPPVDSEDVEGLGGKVGAMVGAYLRGLVVLIFANGIGAGFLIYLLGLFFGNRYALVVGVLTGITAIVPYIGPIVSVGSAFLLTYVTALANPLVAAILAAVLMLAMSQYFALVVHPKIIGRKIHLHPLVVIFAIFGGYEIMGVAGIILGIPVAGTIKIVLAQWFPTVGPGPGVREPTEPLLLDIRAGIRRIHARLSGESSQTEMGSSGSESDSDATAQSDNSSHKRDEDE